MINTTIFEFCDHCSFVPFCLPGERNLSWATQINHAVKQFRSLKRNEILCLPNNKFQNLYAIQHGVIKTYQTEADGNELIRGFYFAGEILGYEAIYTNRYPFSAAALSETVICEIPYANFLELLQAKPLLQKRILYLMSRQLNMGSYLVSTTAEQRIAAFLLDLAMRLHPMEEIIEFVLPITRQDMGRYLRLTAETVSRAFSRLQKMKVIAINHRKIEFLCLDKLRQIAEGVG